MAQISLLLTLQYIICVVLWWSYMFLWVFWHRLHFSRCQPLKNCYQSAPVGSSSSGGGHYFPLPQKHSEIKCLLKRSSNWIEVQVCLEQNECSQRTETHSRTESSASPRGRAIALGRPPGKLAGLKLRDPNSAHVNLKNTRSCTSESVRPGPSVAPFRWLIAGQIFLKQPPIIRCN